MKPADENISIALGKPLPAGRIDQLWEERAVELQLDALPRARMVAEKWAATVSALLGLASIAAIVKRPDDVLALTTTAQHLVAVALGVAVTAAIVGTVTAGTAAHGSLTPLAPFTGGALREWSLEQMPKVQGLLVWSRIGTTLAVAGLLTAAAVTWFGPTRSPAAKLIITQSNGSSRCGVPTKHQNGSVIRLRLGTRTYSVPVAGIRGLKIGHC